MDLTLSLSEQESEELSRRATAAGTDVKTFLLLVMHQPDGSHEPSANGIPDDHWKRDFQFWLDGHRTRYVNMDDSRKCICE